MAQKYFALLHSHCWAIGKKHCEDQMITNKISFSETREKTLTEFVYNIASSNLFQFTKPLIR